MRGKELVTFWELANSTIFSAYFREWFEREREREYKDKDRGTHQKKGKSKIRESKGI